MTDISQKFTLLAIVEEVTEGVPVSPTAGTQYTPIQGDIKMTPARDTNQNAELKASIGMSKSVPGAEKPTFTMSHYLKPSGTEGTAPDWAPMLEGVFGTKTVVSGSEETLTSGSTTTVLNAASGHGANFAKGRPVLVKDPTNGTAVRFVDSISTDALSLSFPLSGAPASGVKVGKPVYFSPAQQGHKSYALWAYIGNGGMRNMIAGHKFGKFSYSVTAGGLINCSLSGQGTGFYWDPVELTETKYLDFTDDDATHAAAVPAGMYKTPKALADALQAAMLAANGAKAPTVTYDTAAGEWTIKTTGTVLSLLFSTGTNTAHTIATALGFSAAADLTGTAATTGYTGSARTLTAPQTPTYDAADPIVAKDQEFLIGDGSKLSALHCSDFTFEVDNTLTVKKDAASATGTGGIVVTGRSAKWTAKLYGSKYDTSMFDQFNDNANVRVQHTAGTKSGGQWVAGKTMASYLPSATVDSVDISNDNGIVTIDIKGSAFVPADASGECFIGQC